MKLTFDDKMMVAAHRGDVFHYESCKSKSR